MSPEKGMVNRVKEREERKRDNFRISTLESTNDSRASQSKSSRRTSGNTKITPNGMTNLKSEAGDMLYRRKKVLVALWLDNYYVSMARQCELY
jgi:hypothetical protein